MIFDPGSTCLVTADCSGGSFFGSSGCFLGFEAMGGFGDASEGEPVMTGFCCGRVCGLGVADCCVGGRRGCFLLVSGRCLVRGGTFSWVGGSRGCFLLVSGRCLVGGGTFSCVGGSRGCFVLVSGRCLVGGGTFSCVGGSRGCFLLVSGRCLVGGGTFSLCSSCFSGKVM